MTGQPIDHPSARVTASLLILATIFVVAGVTHFVKPSWFVRIVPLWLPAPLALVLISGLFEILGGVGVLLPATRVAAGWGLIALLVAVFPANVQMLLDAHAANTSRLWQGVLVARLPLQPALIYWVYRAAVTFSA